MTILALELFACLVFGWAMLHAKAHRLDIRLGSHLRVNEMHHLYIGVLLFVASYVWGGWWLRIPALVITWDDAFQHAVQAFQGWPWFRSPLNAALVWAADRWPFLQRVSIWLDARF